MLGLMEYSNEMMVVLELLGGFEIISGRIGRIDRIVRLDYGICTGEGDVCAG